MTRVGIAGDWHGSFNWTRAGLKTLGDAGVKQVFHAGDFSIAFTGRWPDLVNICESVCKSYDMQLFITPGNHENWEWIESREYDDDGLHWVSDSVAIMRRNTIMRVEDRTFLSLGGAVSVDRSMRTRGIDYFPEEEIQYGDILRLEALVKEVGDVDIMVCHDAPGGGTDAVQRILDIPPHMSIFPAEGIVASGHHRATMETAFNMVQPKVFVHGHFHAPDMKQVDDTLFVSLGCNGQPANLGLLDLETLQVELLDPKLEYLQ
jgi:predicted phosphodiesterase